MRTYEGPATLVLGERSFEITLAIDEGQGTPGLPVLGGAVALDGPEEPWGGYYELAEPGREQELDEAASEQPTAILRLPDGSASEVSLHDGGRSTASAPGRPRTSRRIRRRAAST